MKLDLHRETVVSLRALLARNERTLFDAIEDLDLEIADLVDAPLYEERQSLKDEVRKLKATRAHLLPEWQQAYGLLSAISDAIREAGSRAEENAA